jgi:hypothetical protein
MIQELNKLVKRFADSVPERVKLVLKAKELYIYAQ